MFPPGAASGSRPWWEAAFGAEYELVYPHRDLESARREVDGLIALGLAGRVLDLACGWGRHLVAMRERGLDAFGIDRSAELLARAPAELAGRLARGDLRRLPLRDGAFDGIASLFSSFGYFDEGGDREVMRELARVLRAGGLAVVDLMNSARVRAELVPASERTSGGWRIRERRSLVQDGRRVRKEVVLIDPHGGERRWTEDVRLYERSEVEALAEDAGLRAERWAGDFDGSPAGRGSPRAIALLRRAP
jgi:SAM-dependent methyltransferase